MGVISKFAAMNRDLNMKAQAADCSNMSQQNLGSSARLGRSTRNLSQDNNNSHNVSVESKSQELKPQNKILQPLEKKLRSYQKQNGQKGSQTARKNMTNSKQLQAQYIKKIKKAARSALVNYRAKKDDRKKNQKIKTQPKFVALMAPQNKILLSGLLRRLKWRSDKNVRTEHILENKFKASYSKSVETHIMRRQINEQMHHRQQQSNQKNESALNQEYEYPEEADSQLIDMLWVGHNDPQKLISQNLSHFRVIFNGLDNINEMVNMQNLRDTLLQIRSSILAKTQHCIPNFLLDRYWPSHAELVQVQKSITFELKVLPNNVVHSHENKDVQPQNYVINAPLPSGNKKKTPAERKKEFVKKEEQNLTSSDHLHHDPFRTKAGYRRSVSFVRYNINSPQSQTSEKSLLDVKQLVEISKAQQSDRRYNLKNRKNLIYNNLGEFLFEDNEEFRTKTQTCYIVKKGFSYQTIMSLQKSFKQKEIQEKQIKSAWRNNKVQKQKLQDRLVQDEPIVVRQLLNPLFYRGNDMCTVSVYVFVESFETLRTYIFNNMKVRVREFLDYKEDADFRSSGFGKGKTLYRFGIDDLLKLLYKRAGSHTEDMAQQKRIFWNRICQKILLMMLLMKSQVKQCHGTNKDVPVSKFCQLLQFRFQIDRNGRPWLFGIKNDTTKFTMKDNFFDTFKRHLLLETVICIQKKLFAIRQKEKQLRKEQNLLHMASDQTGAEQVLRSTVENYQFGMDTAGGTVQKTAQQTRVINRVLGKQAMASNTTILKTFQNFDSWTNQNLAKQHHNLMEKPKHATNNVRIPSLFDTNFNAGSLAARRKERGMFLKLKHNEDQLTNFYKHRYNSKSSVRLDPSGIQTSEQYRKSEWRKAYYLGEQQLLEDTQNILACKDPKALEVKINIIKRLGSVLIREGFRLILLEDFNNDLMAFIEHHKLLSEIRKIEDEWLENSLKFVILGVKDPLVFLCQCIEKLELLEVSKKSELRSFKILNKYGKIPNGPSKEQLVILNKFKQATETSSKALSRRRQSAKLDASQMKKILQKSKAAIFIRDKLTSYFNEPTEYEKNRWKIQKELSDIRQLEKDKIDALKSQPSLKKMFKPTELTSLGFDFEIKEVTSCSESSLRSADWNKSKQAKIEITKLGNSASHSSSFDVNQSLQASSDGKSQKQNSKKKKRKDSDSSLNTSHFSDFSDSSDIKQLKTLPVDYLAPQKFPVLKKNMSEPELLLNKTLNKPAPKKSMRASSAQSSSQNSQKQVKKGDISLNFQKPDDSFFYEQKNAKDQEEKFYQNLSSRQPVLATVNQIQAQKLLKRNQTLLKANGNTMSNTQTDGFGGSRQVPSLLAPPKKTQGKKLAVESNPKYRQQSEENKKIVQNKVISNLNSSSLQDLSKSNFQLKRKIPIVNGTNKVRMNPSKPNQQSKMDKSSTQTSFSLLTMTPQKKVNQVTELTNTYNKFLFDNFETQMPFRKKTRQEQMNRLVRSSINQNFAISRQVKHTNQSTEPGIQNYLLSVKDATLSQSKSVSTLAQGRQKYQISSVKKSRGESQFDEQRLDQKHTKANLTDISQAQVQKHMIDRRQSVIRPQMQVQLKTVENKNEVQRQITQKIRRLRTLESNDPSLWSATLNSSLKSMKQVIGTENSDSDDSGAIYLSANQREKYLNRINRAETMRDLESNKDGLEHSNKSSSNDFSSSDLSSSQSSGHSEVFITNGKEFKINVDSQNSSDSGKAGNKDALAKKKEKQAHQHQIKNEMYHFLKKDSMRNPEYMFKQLYPLNAACNEDKSEKSFKRVQVSKYLAEIHVPLRDIRQLATGDDNALARQYMIENTIHRVMKIFDTHDFSQQIFQF